MWYWGPHAVWHKHEPYGGIEKLEEWYKQTGPFCQVALRDDVIFIGILSISQLGSHALAYTEGFIVVRSSFFCAMIFLLSLVEGNNQTWARTRPSGGIAAASRRRTFFACQGASA